LGVVTFLLAVNVLLLLTGNVMEPSSIVLIMAPILFPVAMTHVLPAGRVKAIRCVGHYQNEDIGFDHRRTAMAVDDAEVFARGNLYSANFAVAAGLGLWTLIKKCS
jgi:hypothetical protein